MKTSLIIFTIFLGCTAVKAQFHITEDRIKIDKVPNNIVEFVTNNYKGYRAKYFKIIQKDSSLQYETALKKRNTYIYALFDENTNMLRLDSVIDYRTIPANIKHDILSDLNKRFPKVKIGSCKQSALNAAIFYEIKLKTRTEKYIVQYDYKGEFLSQKVLPKKPLAPIFH